MLYILDKTLQMMHLLLAKESSSVTSNIMYIEHSAYTETGETNELFKFCLTK